MSEAKTPNNPPNLIKQMSKSAIMMSLFVTIGIGILLLAKLLTQEPIRKAESAKVQEAINEVLPQEMYDNNLLKDTINVHDRIHFGTDNPVTIYRARKNGQPAALVLTTIAPDGYNGNIYIMIAVFPDGRISGVRVLSHKETPGLGDKIDVRKSNWVLSFNGMKLRDDNTPIWRVKKDGGQFDQFTGATITPRAVVNAVRRALEYINKQGNKLYD